MTLDEALDVLEVNGSMDFSEIRIVYRDLARVWHPDQYANNQRLSGKATDKFKNINSAYDIIEKHFNSKTQTTSSKPHTSQEQSHQSEQKDQKNTNQSKEKIELVVTRCINCGTNNRIPKTKLYCSSVRCGKCGKNPHLRRKESEPAQQPVGTDETERMKQRFAKYRNKAYKPTVTQQEKKQQTESSKRILCSDGRCIGVLGDDGCCKECGKYSRCTLNKEKILCNHDTCIGFLKDNGRCGVCGKKPVPKIKAKPKENMHIGSLVLCSNSKCWGEIGSNGRCNRCGRLQMNN